MKRYGIIGNPLEHSFSSDYFNKKFKEENIEDSIYENFLLDSAEDLRILLRQFPDLIGLNVTIPFKEDVIPHLDELDETAKEIGAVNTLQISKPGTQSISKGYNTDAPAFQQTIRHLNKKDLKALVLGSGGAAKAVCFALRNLNIEYSIVSRNPVEIKQITYRDLTKKVISDFHLIVNTTPVGMFPNINSAPDIPYESISDKHILYDLIYNPEETEFLKRGRFQGAKTINGMDMLHLQAALAWKIFRQRSTVSGERGAGSG